MKCKLYGDPREIDKLGVSRGERNERLHMQVERRYIRERMVSRRLSGINVYSDAIFRVACGREI